MKIDIKGRTVAIIGDMESIYDLHVEYYMTYHVIRLKETEPNRDFSDKVYTHAKQNRTVVTINPKGTTLTFHPEPNKMFIAKIESIKPMKKRELERIQREIERNKKVAEFQKFLKSLGLKFNIDFHPYREDADYMTVYYKGKEIFSGTTEDL